MAWRLLLFSIVAHSGCCTLWVSQPSEVRTQEGTTAILPCSFNATPGRLAIGSVTWYRDKAVPGKEMKNETPEFRGRLGTLATSRFSYDHQAELYILNLQGRDTGVYVCRVEVLGLGVGTGNGTRLVVQKGEAAKNPEAQRPMESGALLYQALYLQGPDPSQFQASMGLLLLRAALYAFSFLLVAMGSTFYYQGKCHCPLGTLCCS
ncbi:natural cytotoxicity triggering receptor 3 isoform X1 [Ochotona princeps]|uniref:natural cytotoxicity triggering receptor 3 isoform X1 n=1 Tax=Ochotona princeps TaxID=9978 RepID=UPI0027151B13|nr:natural cytotoxicity triggering receptor 3 isoform X1 [Ochotona princeps]